MFPQLLIDINKITHNTSFLTNMCRKRGINVWGVTKCFCGMEEVAYGMYKGGVLGLADSRIDNLIKFKDIPIKKILLRLPMDSEIEKVVTYADISLNSEMRTLKKLGEAATKLYKEHLVVLMVDLGDLREGILPEDIDEFIAEAAKIQGIRIVGMGVNLTCYGGVIPDEENLGQLVEISSDMSRKYNIQFNIISGGNSSSLYMVKDGNIPGEINNLRLGESILLGRETAFGKDIEGMYNDCFIYRAKIIEIKEKPSVPIGQIGCDAFGRTPAFNDVGVIKRAILAGGLQDVDSDSIYPVDKGIKILGSSSDHMIIHITDEAKDYKLGDIVDFRLGYGGLLRANTSGYVEKVFIKN